MWLKRFFAVLAMLLVIFSVSLVPAYGDTPAAAVNSPLFLYVDFPTARIDRFDDNFIFFHVESPISVL